MAKNKSTSRKLKLVSSRAEATARKPNILVIWGDDIGISNLSCYTHRLMSYQTPNFDRIAKEGMPLRVRRHHVEHILRLLDHERHPRARGASHRRKFVETFKEFPPVQKPNTFTVDDALERISCVGGGS